MTRKSFVVGLAGILGLVLSSCTGVSSNEEQWQRARSACAQVGLPPDSSEVGACAGMMQAALLPNNG